MSKAALAAEGYGSAFSWKFAWRADRCLGHHIFLLNPSIISVPTLIEEIQLVGVCGRNFLRCIVIKQAIDRGFLEQGETQNL